MQSRNFRLAAGWSCSSSLSDTLQARSAVLRDRLPSRLSIERRFLGVSFCPAPASPLPVQFRAGFLPPVRLPGRFGRNFALPAPTVVIQKTGLYGIRLRLIYP
jgi:hypothetical protein